MINYNKICIFDFETTSRDPEFTQPISLGAVMLDGRRLTICDNGLFYGTMNIVHDDEVDLYNLRPLEKQALEKNKFTVDQIKTFPNPKNVWDSFTNWVKFHTPKDNAWEAPIAAGFNLPFDMQIANRLQNGHLHKLRSLQNKPMSRVALKKAKSSEIIDHYKLHKEPWGFGPNWLFYPAMAVDIAQMCFMIFESMKEPHRRSLDVIKEYLGFDSINAHHALVDVLWTAEIYIRIQKLLRSVVEEVDWVTEGETVLPIHNILKEKNII